MRLEPFILKKNQSEYSDAGDSELEKWLNTAVPLYLKSAEYQKLPEANKKPAGKWFREFMRLYLDYIGKDLRDLNEAGASKIMLKLYPRKILCLDTEVKTIVPEILAFWQFLARKINEQSNILKHAQSIIRFLNKIKRAYTDYHKVKYSSDGDIEIPIEVFQRGPLAGSVAKKTSRAENWVSRLIEDSVQNLHKTKNASQTPNSWLSLTNNDNFTYFLYHLFFYGFDEKRADIRNAIGQLLNFACTELFMLIRQGDRKAIEFWQATEADIISIHARGEPKSAVMAMLISALTEYKQFLSQEFLHFIHKWRFSTAKKKDSRQADSELVKRVFTELIAAIPDEFTALTLLREYLGFIPPGGLLLLNEMLPELGGKTVDTLALMTLDDNEEDAIAAAEVLTKNPAAITPKTLSRLIRIRNWLAAPVQKPIDRLIRSLRKTGTTPATPASIASENILGIYMSGVDGSGAQSVFLLVRDGVGFRLFAFILKEAVGVIDVVITPTATKAEASQHITMAKCHLGSMETVSLSLIAQQLPFFLALNRSSKVAIDHRLVQVMEMLGLDNWNPESANLSALYDNILQTPPSDQDIADAQNRSKHWTRGGIGDSWFENPDTIDPLGPFYNKNYQRIFDEILEPARYLWGERMGRMALWCKGAINKRRQKQSKDFAVVSWLLNHSGMPVQDINITRSIARKSV